MRVFFATDIHGSEVCWRKFLNAGKFHKADVLIMGGDMTGKAMVPIVANGSNWELELQGQRHVLTTEDELRAMEKRISDRGYYPVRLTRDEVDAWAADATLVDTRFKAEMLASVERWMALGDERLAGTGIRCIVSPANDDMFEIDPIIERAEHLELGEANTIALDGFTLISTGWANPTPWNTFRELPEPELRERIDGLVAPGPRPTPGDLQLPRPALRLEPRQRAQARCQPADGHRRRAEVDEVAACAPGSASGRRGTRSPKRWGTAADARLLRDRHPRLRGVLAQVPQRGRLPQGRRPDHGRRHDRQGDGPDRRQQRAAGRPSLQEQRHVLRDRGRGPGDGEADRRPRLLPGPPVARGGRRLGDRPGARRRPVQGGDAGGGRALDGARPTSDWRDRASAASSRRPTTTSSRSTRSSTARERSSWARRTRSRSTGSRSSRPAGPTRRRGTRSASCPSPSSGSGSTRSSSEVPDPHRAIFNFHAPPYGSNLDNAPKLDADMNYVSGGQALVPVGSQGRPRGDPGVRPGRCRSTATSTRARARSSSDPPWRSTPAARTRTACSRRRSSTSTTKKGKVKRYLLING